MREIKFRAWNIEKEFMCPWDDIQLSMMAARNNAFESKNFIMEQFTGLRDSKGVDIYEGDILSYDLYNPSGDDPKHGVVVFDKYTGFYLDNIIEFNFMIAQGTEPWKRQEVIGNIHQNPELFSLHQKLGPDNSH